MLSPKRVKHRKVQRGNMPGNATRCNTVVFGEYAVVKPGTVMFELGGGINRSLAEEAITLAGAKLPIKTKFVARSDMELGA